MTTVVNKERLEEEKRITKFCEEVLTKAKKIPIDADILKLYLVRNFLTTYRFLDKHISHLIRVEKPYMIGDYTADVLKEAREKMSFKGNKSIKENMAYEDEAFKKVDKAKEEFKQLLENVGKRYSAKKH